MRSSIRFIAAAGLACAVSFALGATRGVGPQTPVDFAPSGDARVALRAGDGTAMSQGGTMRLRFNTPLLQEFGLGRAEGARQSTGSRQAGFSIDLSPHSTFNLHGTQESVHAVVGGSGSLRSGLRLAGSKVPVDFAGMRYVVHGDAASPRIDFVARDGRVLFYADSLMFEWIDGGATFRIRSADLRVSIQLAELLGAPLAADSPIAELHLVSPLRNRALGAVPKGTGTPNFHGEAVPGVPGETYQTDVFMQMYDMTYFGCNGCNGSGGQIKFVPTSTLVNNTNNGTLAQTVNDPIGTSAARFTADVSWYEKFTTSPWAYPYPGNDQHPYLIWNLYRLGANGSLVQIGRSSVKHAFLTANSGDCAPGLGGNHILRRGCADTYGTGNNDNPFDLGPRSEIVPATGQFGRCRSIFDTNCDGVEENSVSSGPFDRRMLVQESALNPTLNPGASFLTESWYIVQDDINVYNTMATRPFSSVYNASFNTWSSTNGTPFRLGPAIDRWVNPSVFNPLASNRELSVTEGHAKVAVKVVDLGGGSYRYNYAVMNVDFARAVTQGTPPNLEVLRNLGFNSFSMPVRTGGITNVSFDDGDSNPANDWSGQLVGNRVTWTAPAGNELNWGTLYSFSFIAAGRPFEMLSNLGVAEAGIPSSYSVHALAPDSDILFANGFE